MSDIERLFLAAYPLFPAKLVEKFLPLLHFEIAKFNPELDKDIVAKYSELSLPKFFEIQPGINNTSVLFNPIRQSALTAEYYNKIKVNVFFAKLADGAWLNFPVDLFNQEEFSGKIIFDKRIIHSVQSSIDIKYKNTYDTSLPQIYSAGGGLFVDVYYLTASAVLTVNPVLQKFNGASSVLAMIENGKSVNVDKALLTEFVTFLNAYSKYSAQLAAASSLQSEKNNQDLQQYKNVISDKLTARKNELNDLRTQISFAARNETASARRDMQNLVLNAQSLMLQLQEKIQ